jgi:hypothetical protein
LSTKATASPTQPQLAGEALQLGEAAAPERVADAVAVPELGDVADPGVLLRRRLAAAALDDLGVDVRVAGRRRRRPRRGRGRQVLGGVHPEAVDAERDEVVQVRREPAADVRRLGPQVGEVDELAVLDLPAVAPVRDVVGAVAAAVVEVAVAVRDGGVGVVRVRRPAAAGPVDAPPAMWLTTASTKIFTPAAWQVLDHRGERGAVAAAAGELVAHRLVVLPPRVAAAGQDDVLRRRRHLDGAEALRAERRRALLRDRGPGPLEEVDDDVLRARRRG